MDTKRIISNVIHATKPTAAVQQRLEARLNARPDLDANTVACVCKRHIVDVEVFYNVSLVGVLAKRADADAMRAGAV